MTETAKAKGVRIEMAIAIVASVAWSAFAIYLFRDAAPCNSETGAVFACLKGNERGDMLAGVFAPLAFIWLVATVLIQSSELKDQRKVQIQTLELMSVQTRIERQREISRMMDVSERYLHRHINTLLETFKHYTSTNGFLQVSGANVVLVGDILKESTEKSAHAMHEELATLLFASNANGLIVTTGRPDLLEPFIVSWKGMIDQCSPLFADALDRLGYVQLAYIELMLEAISSGTWSSPAPTVDWNAINERGSSYKEKWALMAMGVDFTKEDGRENQDASNAPEESR